MIIDADWQPRITNDFLYLVGPVLERLEEGRRAFAFMADARHVNDRGVVHGGMLMTFADQAFGQLVLEAVERRLCATVQLNTHFIAAVQVGDLVEARAEIVRKTRSLVFMRGFLTVGERVVASADGIWKVLHNGG